MLISPSHAEEINPPPPKGAAGTVRRAGLNQEIKHTDAMNSSDASIYALDEPTTLRVARVNARMQIYASSRVDDRTRGTPQSETARKRARPTLPPGDGEDQSEHRPSITSLWPTVRKAIKAQATANATTPSRSTSPVCPCRPAIVANSIML